VDHIENVKWTLNPDKDINYRHQLPKDIGEILERSRNLPNITKEELYMLLFKGILIENEEKVLFPASFPILL